MRRPVRRKKRTTARPKIKAKIRKKKSPRIAFSAPVAEASAPVFTPQEDRRLPSHYGEDRLALLVRDPWWLFAYWEITEERQRPAMREIEQKGLTGRKTVLRIYDVTGVPPEKPHSFFDIILGFHADNWYVDVGLPDREWVAEIGFRVDGGRFFSLLRSNTVRTPSFGISDVLDEEWMLPEDVYTRLIGRSIGGSGQGGSMDIRRLLEKYLKNTVSSERVAELSKKTSGTTPS